MRIHLRRTLRHSSRVYIIRFEEAEPELAWSSTVAIGAQEHDWNAKLLHGLLGAFGSVVARAVEQEDGVVPPAGPLVVQELAQLL